MSRSRVLRWACLLAITGLILTGSWAQGQTLSREELKPLRIIAIPAPSLAEITAALAGAVLTPSGPRAVTTVVLLNSQVSKNQDAGDSFRVGASETSLAVTGKGDRLVAGWNDGEGFSFAPFNPDAPPLGLSGYGFSTDGGKTWIDAGAPSVGSVIGFGPGPSGRSKTGQYVTRGDPWLDVADHGVEFFYFANLSVWTDDAELPPAGVSVHRGRFFGKDFSWTSAVLLQSPNYPRDFLDKNAMAAGGINVYVTVTNFIETCGQPSFGFGQIELYFSLNEGATWFRTVVQPDETAITDPTNPLCGADGVINQGSAPAIGPSGEVYVAWERGWFAPIFGGTQLNRATIAFRRSTDQGASFGPRRTIASICSMLLTPPAGYNRLVTNDFPRIAVAHAGANSGRIYVSFHDCTAAMGLATAFGQDTDVYVSFSDDQGNTWSTPTPLHPTADGKIQFWPVVTVDGQGRVSVIYYESRETNVTPDPTDFECQVRVAGSVQNPIMKRSTVSSLVDVFQVRSTDGGQTWSPPLRLTTATTNWCTSTPVNSIIPNFGDYIDARATGTVNRGLWAEGRNGGRADHIPTVWYGTGP